MKFFQNLIERVAMTRQSIFYTIFFLFSALSGFVFGQNPNRNDRQETMHQSRIIKTIFVTGNEHNINLEGKKEGSGVQIKDLQVPERPEELESLLRRYLNKQFNKIILASIMADLKHFYRDRQLPPVSIKVFPKSSEGNLQILITKKEILHTPIKSLLITSKKEEIQQTRPSIISEVQIVKLDLPGHQERLSSLMQSFIGKEISKEELQNIRKEIHAYYHNNYLPPVQVHVFPNQKTGDIQILVTPKPKMTGRIKGIFITGNKETFQNEKRLELTDIELEDLQISGKEEELKGILYPFLDKELSKDQLREMQKAIAQFYTSHQLPPISIKVNVKKGIIYILISLKEKKGAVIRGIFITGDKNEILPEGQMGIYDIEIRNLEIQSDEEGLKSAIRSYLGKRITKEELRSLQKEILRYLKDQKTPPVTIKISPKKKGGVLQILISKKPAAKKKEKGKGKKGAKTTKKPAEPIKGIFVTTNRDAIIKEGREIEGVVIDDLMFSIWNENLHCYLNPFIGKKATKKELAALKKKLIYYIKTSTGTPISLNVTFTIRKGVIQALISFRRVGKITYKGAKWMSEAQIAHIFNIHQGELVNKERIRNNFAWLNQNVFHQSKIKFTPSKTSPGDIDILITTKDRFPLRFYTTVDNTGYPAIGREKIMAGVSWGNAFWMNDILTYEGSTSNIPKRYQSHTLNYLVFLPWQHRFSVFANHSETRPEIKDSRVKAFGNQLRVRYIIPYKPLYTRFQQLVGGGFDVKYGHGYSLNTANPRSVPSIRKGQVAQLVGNYTIYNTTKKHNFSLILNVYWSPGRILAHQSKKAFEARRHFSQVNYAYFNLWMNDIYKLPKGFELAGALTLQKATATLPASELIGIGGYNTVRGYRPYEFSADNGLIANFEIHTPKMKILKFFNNRTKVTDQLFFLGFIDYGIGYNYNHTVINPRLKKDWREEWALGTGFGLRYQIQQYLSLRCDYGFKLHHMHAHTKSEKRLRRGDGELHFGLLLAY